MILLKEGIVGDIEVGNELWKILMFSRVFYNNESFFDLSFRIGRETVDIRGGADLSLPYSNYQ